jgi:hypothetical protein
LKKPERRGLAKALLVLLAFSVPATLSASEAFAQSGKSSRTAKSPPDPMPANIDRNGVVILVRSALLALDQANKTGNYTVLRDLGSPGFQKNSAADLARIFTSQREQAIDLGGVAVLDPQLTLLPQIEPNGMLHMAGFFPSVPTQVDFELLFAPADHRWKIFGISVNLSSGTPEAPDVLSDPEPTVSTEMPDPPTPEINPRRKATVQPKVNESKP